MLSKAGKAILIKAIAQTIPTYTMTTFRLPISTCKEMNSVVKRFWWTTNSKCGKYLAMKSWEAICKPKEHGGLGFKKFSNFNLALLSKLNLKLGSGEDSLWTRIMRVWRS